MKDAPARGYDARVDEQAIEQAERELEKPREDWARPVFVYVPLHLIVERPDLLPPGDQQVNPRHQEDLQARIAQGEAVDPPLVMKFSGRWVCIEGHARIAAYRTLEPRQNIKCEWFDGTVREAADVHLRNLRRSTAFSGTRQQGPGAILEPKDAADVQDVRSHLVEVLRLRPQSVSDPEPSYTFGHHAETDAHTVGPDAQRPNPSRPRVPRRNTNHVAINKEELQAATNATLRAHATSEEAKVLVANLARMVEDHGVTTGARKNRRRSTAGKLEYATGALLANLLKPLGAHEPNGWVYRSMHADAFTGCAVSHRTFVQLVDGLTELGLVERVEGHRVASDPADAGKYAARFRATSTLLQLCGEHGVQPRAALDHFEYEYDLPRHPIELRAKKVGGYYNETKLPGKPMVPVRTLLVERLEEAMHELNEFFAKQTLRGGSHEGYIRIFHNGDDPYFNWNLGGRLYSQHFTESYQVLNADERARMTINGEAVKEIDIKASYLTIFLSLHGVQLDGTKDPYGLPGFGENDRAAVKAWMVATFGNSKPIRRWPPRMLKDTPDLRQYKASAITAAALTHYPELREWGRPLKGRVHCWADLMWIESAAVLATMLTLIREHSIPSLSVHDSLIVPASKVEVASKTLTKMFSGLTGARPLLETKNTKKDR